MGNVGSRSATYEGKAEEEGREPAGVSPRQSAGPSPHPCKRNLANIKSCKDKNIFDVRIAEALAKVASKLAKETEDGVRGQGGAAGLNRTLLRFGRIREAFNQVQVCYRKYDLNKDGTIQFSELVNCIKDLANIDDENSIQEATKIIFSSSDMYNNGKLSFKEFLVGLHLGYVLGMIPLDKLGGQNLKTSFESVIEAFLVFDSDSKGYFTREEMAGSLIRLSSHSPSKQYLKAKKDAAEATAAAAAGVDEKEHEFTATAATTTTLMSNKGIENDEKEGEGLRKKRVRRRHSMEANTALQFLTRERMDEMDW